jgi:hypothetical protein
MKRRGLRERLVPGAPAQGNPFDNGLFELVTEPFDAPEPVATALQDLVKLTRKARPAS